MPPPSKSPVAALKQAMEYTNYHHYRVWSTLVRRRVAELLARRTTKTTA